MNSESYKNLAQTLAVLVTGCRACRFLKTTAAHQILWDSLGTSLLALVKATHPQQVDFEFYISSPKHTSYKTRKEELLWLLATVRLVQIHSSNVKESDLTKENFGHVKFLIRGLPEIDTTIQIEIHNDDKTDGMSSEEKGLFFIRTAADRLKRQPTDDSVPLTRVGFVVGVQSLEISEEAKRVMQNHSSDEDNAVVRKEKQSISDSEKNLCGDDDSENTDEQTVMEEVD